MKKFRLTIATMIVAVGLVGCADKENEKATTEITTEVTTEATTEEVTTEEVTTEEVTTEAEVEVTTEEVAEITTETISTKPVQQNTTASAKPSTSMSVKPSTPATSPAPAPTQNAQQSTAPAPAPSTSPAPVQQSSEPAPTTEHQHSWATKTVVTKDAWTETVEHPAVTHQEMVEQCNYCYEYFPGNSIYAHQDQFLDTDITHAISGYGTTVITVTDQEAWTETIEHPAETKTVEYCTSCGVEK